MTYDQIYNMAEKLGIPFVIFIFFSLGVFRLLMWIGNRVVLPISQSHIQLVKSTEQAQKTNTDTLAKVADILKINLAATERIVSQNGEVIVSLKDAHTKIDKLVPLK